MALLCLPSFVAPSPVRPLQSSDCGVSKSTRSCGSRLARSAAFFDITPHGSESRPRDRRPLGVRIWLADVAARLSVCRARRGEARRRASGALRLFLRPPRDARAAGSRARPRPRWNLSRHRLSRNRGDTIAYLRAREQVTSVYRECVRPIWLKRESERRVPALCYMVDRGHAQYAGRLSLEQQLHHVRQGHGQSGANRDYVIATVGALEQLGYRETALHLIAQRLAGIHEAGVAANSSS